MNSDMRVEGQKAMEDPSFPFRPWIGTWTLPQAREADAREKAEQQALEAEFGWMKEADHWLLGHGQYPVP
jgi:hypothetical protein